jgi:hypothetical protein
MAKELLEMRLDADEPKVKRVPVSFLWSKLNWDFLKMLAEIAQYAEGKYGSAEQYTNARLENQASPINHIYEHLRQYQAGEPHDRFGDSRYHLAAIAYNAMMEYFYHTAWGQKLNVIMQRQRKETGSTLFDEMAARANEVEVAALADTGDPEILGVDWAEGFAHFRDRWKAGLDGARSPETIRRWTAFLWVLDQFEGVAMTDEVVRKLIDDIKATAKEQLPTLKTPENIEDCTSKMAACDTLRSKIPDMFPGKDEKS